MPAPPITVPQIADMLNKLVRQQTWGSIQIELKNGKITCVRRVETLNSLQDESHLQGEAVSATYHEQSRR